DHVRIELLVNLKIKSFKHRWSRAARQREDRHSQLHITPGPAGDDLERAERILALMAKRHSHHVPLAVGRADVPVELYRALGVQIDLLAHVDECDRVRAPRFDRAPRFRGPRRTPNAFEIASDEVSPPGRYDTGPAVLAKLALFQDVRRRDRDFHLDRRDV